MRLLKSPGPYLFFLSLLLPAMTASQSIPVTTLPSGFATITGQQITVPIIVDMSQVPERLGSLTAHVSWDAQQLQFVTFHAGTAKGFDNPFVNTHQTEQAKITFAAVNPFGAEGKVNILNLVFKVIARKGTIHALAIKFKAMSAAYTFNNLLPFLSMNADSSSGLAIIELPQPFAVLYNDPNPFHPEANITYHLAADAQVHLLIYDLLGEAIRNLEDEWKSPGEYSIRWDGKDEKGRAVAAGVYIYKLHIGSFTEMKIFQLKI